MPTYTLNTPALMGAAREAGDTSLYRIHKRTGITASILSRIARGANAPSLDTALRLAAAYGISVESLISESTAA
jgi:transcriptional regulator with XRE-family HTH domain